MKIVITGRKCSPRESFKERAEKKLAKVERFFGDEAARRYCEGLKEELEQLARYPLNGRPEPEIDDRTRSQPFRRHTIYYEPDGDGIVVLRVLQDVVSA